MMAKRLNLDWEQIVREQENSGKNITDFCREKGFHPNTFNRHKKKVCSSGFIQISSPLAAFEVSDDRAAGITISFGSITVKLEKDFCEDTLQRLLSVLGIIQ